MRRCGVRLNKSNLLCTCATNVRRERERERDDDYERACNRWRHFKLVLNGVSTSVNVSVSALTATRSLPASRHVYDAARGVEPLINVFGCISIDQIKESLVKHSLGASMGSMK